MHIVLIKNPHFLDARARSASLVIEDADVVINLNEDGIQFDGDPASQPYLIKDRYGETTVEMV